MDNSPKALILTECLGSPTSQGVHDSIQRVTRLLGGVDVSIYCSPLHATDDGVANARALGVQLVLPNVKPKSNFKSRTFQSDRQRYQNSLVANLKGLENTKFVFAFGISTTETATWIAREIYPTAAVYTINLWSNYLVTPITVRYGREELRFRRDLLLEESQIAKFTFPTGHRPPARDKPNSAHGRQLGTQIPFTAGGNGADLKSLDECEHVVVLSLFEKSELNNVTCLDTILKALNSVVASHSRPLTWKVFGLSPKQRTKLLKRVQADAKLEVVSLAMPSATAGKQLESELLRTHMLLMPSSSKNYANLIQAALFRAVPLILPKGSPSHQLLENHMELYADSVAVDMINGSDALAAHIDHVIADYQTILQKAVAAKEVLQQSLGTNLADVDDAVRSLHEDFSSLGLVTGSVQRKRRLWSKRSKKAKKGEMSAVQDSKKQGFFKSSMKRKQETQLTRETSSGRARLAAASTEKQQAGDQVKEEETKKQKRKKPFIRRPAHKQRLNDRNTYDLEVRVVIKGIIPAEGRSVRAVDSAFFSCYRTRRNAREVARKLSRKGLYVREYDYRRLSFILVCQTLKGVESLMKDYSSARLQQLMEEQFLSLSLNDDIGALYLALQASIDYEEYMMCTEELEEEPWEDPYAVPEVVEVNIADQIKEEELQNIRKTVRELRDDVTRLQTRNIKLTESNEMKYLCIDFQRALSTKEQTRHQCELKSLALECTQIKADGEREMSSRNALMKMKVTLKERAEKIISEALVDSEIKELYRQARQVENGIPLKGTSRTLRVRGPIPGHTVWTYGIYVKTNGDLVLCEPENGRVLIMTGDFQCEWVLAFAAFAKPFKPWDVAVKENDDIYHVCDGGNDQIVVSSVQSAVLKTYGHDEDIIPMSVCFNGDGHSLVADYTGYIRKYDQDGKHVTRSEDGQIVLPLCVRVNSTNEVIVSEERKGIQILDCQLRALRRFGQQILRGPRGLYVDKSDIVCVCDWGGGQVARFDIKGVFQGYLYHDQFERPINISMITNDLCRFVVTQGAFVNLLYV